MRTLLLTLGFLTALSAADAPSALTGTWQLRLGKSKMRPTQIKTEIAVITQKDPVTWHYAYDFEYVDGRKTHNETDRVFDGKERPTANGRIEVGEHWDEFNWVSRQTKDGKLVSEIHSTVATDRKTQTVHRTTVNETETIREEIVFERIN